jgi:hypothetical protein
MRPGHRRNLTDAPITTIPRSPPTSWRRLYHRVRERCPAVRRPGVPDFEVTARGTTDAFGEAR